MNSENKQIKLNNWINDLKQEKSELNKTKNSTIFPDLYYSSGLEKSNKLINPIKLHSKSNTKILTSINNKKYLSNKIINSKSFKLKNSAIILPYSSSISSLVESKKIIKERDSSLSTNICNNYSLIEKKIRIINSNKTANTKNTSFINASNTSIKNNNNSNSLLNNKLKESIKQIVFNATKSKILSYFDYIYNKIQEYLINKESLKHTNFSYKDKDMNLDKEFFYLNVCNITNKVLNYYFNNNDNNDKNIKNSNITDNNNISGEDIRQQQRSFVVNQSINKPTQSSQADQLVKNNVFNQDSKTIDEYYSTNYDFLRTTKQNFNMSYRKQFVKVSKSVSKNINIPVKPVSQYGIKNLNNYTPYNNYNNPNNKDDIKNMFIDIRDNYDSYCSMSDSMLYEITISIIQLMTKFISNDIYKAFLRVIKSCNEGLQKNLSSDKTVTFLNEMNILTICSFSLIDQKDFYSIIDLFNNFFKDNIKNMVNGYLNIVSLYSFCFDYYNFFRILNNYSAIDYSFILSKLEELIELDKLMIKEYSNTKEIVILHILELMLRYNNLFGIANIKMFNELISEYYKTVVEHNHDLENNISNKVYCKNKENNMSKGAKYLCSKHKLDIFEKHIRKKYYLLKTLSEVKLENLHSKKRADSISRAKQSLELASFVDKYTTISSGFYNNNMNRTSYSSFSKTRYSVNQKEKNDIKQTVNEIFNLDKLIINVKAFSFIEQIENNNISFPNKIERNLDFIKHNNIVEARVKNTECNNIDNINKFDNKSSFNKLRLKDKKVNESISNTDNLNKDHINHINNLKEKNKYKESDKECLQNNNNNNTEFNNSDNNKISSQVIQPTDSSGNYINHTYNKRNFKYNFKDSVRLVKLNEKNNIQLHNIKKNTNDAIKDKLPEALNKSYKENIKYIYLINGTHVTNNSNVMNRSNPDILNKSFSYFNKNKNIKLLDYIESYYLNKSVFSEASLNQKNKLNEEKVSLISFSKNIRKVLRSKLSDISSNNITNFIRDSKNSICLSSKADKLKLDISKIKIIPSNYDQEITNNNVKKFLKNKERIKIMVK